MRYVSRLSARRIRSEDVVAAMLAAHPYEVPAYDIFDDEAVCEEYGMGRAGELRGTDDA